MAKMPGPNSNALRKSPPVSSMDQRVPVATTNGWNASSGGSGPMRGQVGKRLNAGLPMGRKDTAKPNGNA